MAAASAGLGRSARKGNRVAMLWETGIEPGSGPTRRPRRKLCHDVRMKLYVAPMDAFVVEVRPDGCVRLKDEEWAQPTLQERRAIIYAAKEELAALEELLDILDPAHASGS